MSALESVSDSREIAPKELRVKLSKLSYFAQNLIAFWKMNTSRDYANSAMPHLKNVR